MSYIINRSIECIIHQTSTDPKSIDQVAFVAGVADSSGYGWAICKALAEAGATVTVGTWPPVLGIFEKSLKKGSFDDDMKLEDGSLFKIAKVWCDFLMCVVFLLLECYRCVCV